MKSKFFVFLFLIFIFSMTFSSNDKRQKREIQNNILNPQEKYDSETKFHLNPLNTIKLQKNNTILLKPQNDVESADVFYDLLLNKLLKTPNLFRYIFAYLSFFEFEINDFKYASTTFYNLYEKFLKEEKHCLKKCLKNETKFLENINCTRVYFDFFEKRRWSGPSRIEYANVDYFSEDLVLFPKSIRQIIYFTFQEIEYKYVLFKNGNLSILKKVNKENFFVFTSLEKDFDNERFLCFESNNSLKIKIFQEHVRCIEIHGLSSFYVTLHTPNNFIQNTLHVPNHKKIIISQPCRQRNSKLFLKNISGYFIHSSEYLDLWKFEKNSDGIYRVSFISRFQINFKEIKIKDFEHNVEDVLFILKQQIDI